MKKLIITVFIASLNFTVFAAKPISFATEASYPPFEFIGADNEIQGFDIELAQALCKKMDVPCNFTNQAFDSLIPSLKFRRFDAIISGMDITAERLKQVDFSKPYYENSALFITRNVLKQKNTITDIGSLRGKRVGMQNGTTHQQFLQQEHPEITTVPYDSYQNAILDLKNDRLDAVFGDTAVVNEWLKKNKTLVAVGDKITDAHYFGSGLGIAVRHNNTELLNKLNAALVQVRQDGTYQTLYNKWFKQ
ncbi:arginine ABC transporter substrate-binding protein [Candidatus Fukatsuia symbiotica]|uniref:arginine ABC transporter substrate-binding protein n=1 Tax=Candidatus Fukatsuia TaxID=1927833 RepID=UPI0009337604|nr:arginine ABC transporter substrate-binding protein [Candidatus Fukatsuia symbiotica]MEA9445958.1 arginine ABC transporter substrate-binding protein [Candidatus Fukatsuia symbiotica]